MSANTIAAFGSWNGNDRIHTFLVSWSLGVPERSAAQLGGPGIDIAASGPVDESAWVEAHWRIRIEDSSVDGISARVAALAAELRDLSTITVGLKGAAYTGTLVPKLAKRVELPLSTGLVWLYQETVEIVVQREAPVYTAATALYSAAALSLPAVLDLSAMTGDMPSPLDMLFDAATADIHQLVAGYYPAAAQPITKFVLKAVDLQWYATGGGAAAGSAAADANGYPAGVGNTLWRVNTLVGDYTDLDVTDFLGGTYALYANVKRDAGASPATIGTPYGSIDIEGADLRRQLIGLVSLPCASVRGAATSTLRVTLTGDGTDYAYCNTIEIVPVGWGAVGWHHATPASSADKLRCADGLVYADDVAALAYVTLGRELLALGGTLVITGEATAEAPTLAVAGTVAHVPRHEQLPSTGSSSGPGI